MVLFDPVGKWSHLLLQKVISLNNNNNNNNNNQCLLNELICVYTISHEALEDKDIAMHNNITLTVLIPSNTVRYTYEKENDAVLNWLTDAAWRIDVGRVFHFIAPEYARLVLYRSVFTCGISRWPLASDIIL